MACKIIYKGISYDESDFKTQIERYVTINNLFNENETLANAVYSVLGLINTSEIQLDKPRFNPDNVEATSYPIKINEKYAGVISVDKDGYVSSSIGMAGVELEKEFQGKGYGTKVYIALAEQLAKEGKTLKSEAFGKTDINESANRVWKSLLDKGYAFDKGSYFEVQLKNKQQAQQLYSQYVEQTDKQDIEGFKEFLNQNKELETDNIKSELGKNFPEKITEQELNEIKNIILNKNNNNSNIVYILFDIKEISPNLYTWDLRKIKANTTTKTILNDSLEKLLDELKNFNSNIRNNLKKDYIFNTDLFKEMIDIFDNRDFIEGAYYNYYKHKQLQDIGTFEEYVIYLKNKTDENILFKGFRNKSGYVHNTPNHSFYTPDRFIAEKFYLDEKGIKSYIIPKTIDSENKSANFKNDENLGYSVIRKNEEDFINNNGFKIIKLYTNDLGGDQIQYAVKKDFNLLELGSKKDIIEFTNFINNYRNNKELFYNFNFENINPFKC